MRNEQSRTREREKEETSRSRRQPELLPEISAAPDGVLLRLIATSAGPKDAKKLV